MRIGALSITTGVAAVAAVAAVGFAPTALADPNGLSCDATGSGTMCQSPGNVQIDDAPASVPYYSSWGDEFLLGRGLPVGGGHGFAPHFGGDGHGGHR